MTKLKITLGVFGFVVCGVCLAPAPARAFEVSAQERSCAGESGVHYLESEISGEITTKAFQDCGGQAVRQISAIQFEAKSTDDGNCEAFDELVTGTGEFECVAAPDPSPTARR